MRKVPRRRLRWSAVTAVGALLAVASPTGSSTAAEPAPPFVDEQVLFAQRDSGYACFRIPAVVRAADGEVLAFAEGRVHDCGDDGDIDIVLRRSADGGRTWGPLQVVSEGNGSTHGNPVPIVDQRTGRIALVSNHNGPDPCPNGCDRDPYVQTSEDNGATWSPPREMTEGKRPEWNAWYATGPMHGIQLTRGPHAGRLIVGASHETDDGVHPHVYGTHLLYSDDGGLTWNIGANVAVDDGTIIAQEVTVVELTDGRIYALARERGTDPGHRAVAVSSDGGVTFDKPFRTIDLAMPDVQASTLRLHATDQGEPTDRILLSAPAHPVAREAMSVRSSYDEGASWQNWDQGKVFWWGPSAYSDLVKLDGDEIGLYYEAGAATPYESIRWARFNESYLATPNGTPPGIPGPPEPGPTTPDDSGNGNPAYVRGGAAVTPGRFGNGLALDGADDRVEVPFDESIDVAGEDFTMTTWFRYADTKGTHALLWAYRTGSGTTPQLWLRAEPEANRLRALIMIDRFNITVQSAGAYNDGQWHHAALQRTKGRLVLTIDGQEAGSAEVPPGSVTEGKEFGVDGIHIGQRLDGASRLRGEIDDVRVYKRALTPAELELVRTRNAQVGGRLGLWLPLDAQP